ncbi:MAG: alpha-galactosidase [Anaerolineae bacterium]|nr:alpha-galactosidase [Chloroflexi bacterium CFX1]MCQ3947425.1 alpha-galactosidase [Anaerolineae bacterium]RIK26735.1 MAG: alpha-galactosidase [Anaerolineae bacterium]
MDILITDSTPASQTVSASRVTLNLPRPPRAFYRHGWQSWSLAAWTDLSPLPIQKPDIFHVLQTDAAYAREPLPHGSWVGAAEMDDGRIVLLGALGMDAHVRLDGSQLEGWYESGEGEWFIHFGAEQNAFPAYTQALGERFGFAAARPAPRIWCSWYSLYTLIDEPTLHKVFDGLGDLPFDVLQVDDGWQVSLGDWEANEKFPAGMTALADKIKSTGRKAGLWLAPLLAAKSSRLFREHPDWFLKDEAGKFVSAGFNWGEWMYALDTTHPAAQEWLAALMKQVRAWGFDYLKLDFLYAGALRGKRHTEAPREAAYRLGLKVLREAMGADAYFLACGAPIVPSLGLCDALRVGPDVAGEWESHRDAVLLQNPTTPGTRNAIRTTVNRLWLSPLVQTDPDVAYFAAKGNSLTVEQRLLLQDLALVCGFKATSDLPQWMTPAERESLRAFLEDTNEYRPEGGYRYRVASRRVDFTPAIELPPRPNKLESIQRTIFAALGNQPWALRLLDWMGKRSLKKTVQRL